MRLPKKIVGAGTAPRRLGWLLHNAVEAKRRTHRTSRLIAKLRGHGLIAKVKNSRLYRVTHSGVKAIWAAVRCRCIDFPTAFNMSESFAQ